MVSSLWRFSAKVLPGPECWEWTGHHDPKGYSKFWFDGSMGYAHRFAYQTFIGPIPDGLVIDHLCKNRGCVNPGHMEPVTLSENSLRQTPWNRRKTHCPSGHPLTLVPATRRRAGTRECVVCNRRRAREQKQRLREAATNGSK